MTLKMQPITISDILMHHGITPLAELVDDLEDLYQKNQARGKKVIDTVAYNFSEINAEANANANLIAAAPDMYEALDELTRLVNIYFALLDGEEFTNPEYREGKKNLRKFISDGKSEAALNKANPKQ